MFQFVLLTVKVVDAVNYRVARLAVYPAFVIIGNKPMMCSLRRRSHSQQDKDHAR